MSTDRIPPLPSHDLPVFKEEEEEEEEEEAAAKKGSKATPSLPRPSSQPVSDRYSPCSWKGLFDEEQDVHIPGSNNVFHIYIAGSDGPVVFCLHGGGYSGLGGAIAVHVAAARQLNTLAGLVVVDVVEGTAMASLIHMQKILSDRPSHFPSLEKAIEWSVKGGSLRNLASARISVPSTLKFNEHKQCYVWRTPLEESEIYWKGWYQNLSSRFLESPAAKVLLLAGTDRLDRTLTIGQMQGKFQMIIVRHTGHAIQEDAPEEFASIILGFISRNRIGTYGIEIPRFDQPIHMKSAN